MRPALALLLLSCSALLSSCVFPGDPGWGPYGGLPPGASAGHHQPGPRGPEGGGPHHGAQPATVHHGAETPPGGHQGGQRPHEGGQGQSHPGGGGRQGGQNRPGGQSNPGDQVHPGGNEHQGGGQDHQGGGAHPLSDRVNLTGPQVR